LEAIPGVGPKRRQQLVNHFGGQQGLVSASIDAITEVPGISRALAEKIYAALHAS
jgi:excinuclease ABC subunit C